MQDSRQPVNSAEPGQGVTTACPLPRPHRPRWATGIGIVSTVLAGLGLAGYGVVNIYVTVMLVSFDRLGQSQSGLVQIGLMVTAPLLPAGLLLWGGIALLRRRPRGRRLHLIYGFARLALLLGQVGLLLSNLGSRPPWEPFVILGVYVFVTASYPALVLTWFLRRPIREQVRQWRPTDLAGRIT